MDELRQDEIEAHPRARKAGFFVLFFAAGSLGRWLAKRAAVEEKLESVLGIQF